MSYNSQAETEKHIARVRELLERVIVNIRSRAQVHDASKLLPPEKPIFDEYTEKLAKVKYGSEEYKAYLSQMGAALEHHYAANSHHPEHYRCLECQGCFRIYPCDFKGECENCGTTTFTQRTHCISAMSLMDLIEMLCDWKAAGERHTSGSMRGSLLKNRERFGISDSLFMVLEKTADELGFLKHCFDSRDA